uniref:Sorting nexin 29 n=1 Tax=Pygocentrus nattereri TaxID=42514 RepID=A0AAR2KRH7_PYGNA
LSGTQQNDLKRQHLLERLLDAVKQCQIRFGGRKEIASDSDSRVICLCAQFEAVLQHGLKKNRGLALTAAAIKQAAGFISKTEAELTFWFYVKEHLNRHELQRFYSLRNIWSELGRGRAWLRCALNEHSLERYLHMLLADRTRLSAFYEEWAFILDEERASMLPTMAAGLNSILFAINIDNTDLNGQVRTGSSVSHLLKESTQGMSSLWKESAQGVSTLLREIGTATAVVPGFSSRSDCPTDPLPVLPRSTSTDSGLRKERRRKKKITNIISFDDNLDVGVEDEEEGNEDVGRSVGKNTACCLSSEEAEEPPESLSAQNGLLEPSDGIISWAETPPQNGILSDTKSIDNEEEDDEDFYRKSQPDTQEDPASEEQSLRSLLDGEMEHSAGLRLEVDNLKNKLADLEERHAAKVQALGRENEVLKVQLKKYVGAVQMLKREGNQKISLILWTVDDEIPKFLAGTVCTPAALCKCNLLYCSLMAKDNLIGQMRQELIDLRGPVPGDLSQTSDDPSLSDFEIAHRALVNVWIPSVFLQGRAANAYHVYQVYIRILDNEWNVYRRYAEFRVLHNHLRARFSQVDTFNFPPKKAIGNKDAKFVEERRKQLQGYLRMVMNKLIQILPEFTARPTKETLLQLLPFCQDTPAASESGSKSGRSKASSRFPRLGRSSGREARNPEPQSGDL